MIPLLRESRFIFRFGEPRLIRRFHLEGVESGRRISVFRFDPPTRELGTILATATVGEDGWVELTDPIIVRAGEGFVAVPGEEQP
jgi:hypothetical protein